MEIILYTDVITIMEAYNDFTSYVSYQQKCSNFILYAFVSTWEKIFFQKG